MSRTPSRQPALFLGHGSPMNALEDNLFTQAWAELGRRLPRPSAVLCLSAHWETQGWQVTAQRAPRTLHDFRGFPPELGQVEYPAPGSPELAQRVCGLLGDFRACPVEDWGLDHGTWSLLVNHLPAADLPVVQLSLNREAGLRGFVELGRRLGPLREEGVRVLGSGNIVHHLGRLDWGDERGERPHPWAVEFDRWVLERAMAGDLDALAAAEEHPLWPLAAPTREHFLPLLPVLALAEPGEPVASLCPGIVLGSLSMRGFRVG